jgi:hypothetical protein
MTYRRTSSVPLGGTVANHAQIIEKGAINSPHQTDLIPLA